MKMWLVLTSRATSKARKCTHSQQMRCIFAPSRVSFNGYGPGVAQAISIDATGRNSIDNREILYQMVNQIPSIHGDNV